MNIRDTKRSPHTVPATAYYIEMLERGVDGGHCDLEGEIYTPSFALFSSVGGGNLGTRLRRHANSYNFAFAASFYFK